jgi:hypothetical protein
VSLENEEEMNVAHSVSIEMQSERFKERKGGATEAVPEESD